MSFNGGIVVMILLFGCTDCNPQVERVAGNFFMWRLSATYHFSALKFV